MVFDLMVMMCKSDQVLGKRQQIHLCDCLTDITGRHVQKPLNPTRQLCSAIQQVAMDRHKEACFATKTRVIFPLGSCAFQQSLFYRGRKRFALAYMILRQIIIVNERSKLTRFQHLKLTHPMWRKAPRRAALI
ncbi:hypothetical protein PhaeoP59_03040 [Phaeobacter inhibens]|nr:hypothetical protein PhaeoP59_03040 [Phaeobacter inhibens]